MQEAPVVPFRDDSVSISEVGKSMCAALDEGIAVVSISTGTHRRLLEEQLTVHGIDLREASAMGTYASLDAAEVLSSIVVDGYPDVIRFAEVIGAVLDRAAERHGRVSVFAELVPPMRAEQNHAGAIELENLLRSFIAARPVFRDCG
jgi:hypothetical protein